MGSKANGSPEARPRTSTHSWEETDGVGAGSVKGSPKQLNGGGAKVSGVGPCHPPLREGWCQTFKSKDIFFSMCKYLAQGSLPSGCS